jgi:hypothetical protein
VYPTNDTQIYDFKDESGKTAKLILKDRFVSEYAPYGTSTFSSHITRTMNLKLPANYLRVTMDISRPAETDIEVYYRAALSSDYIKFEDLGWKRIDSAIALSQTAEFIETEFEKFNMADYDTVQVKVVFKSTNPAKTPSIRKLRVMALA